MAKSNTHNKYFIYRRPDALRPVDQPKTVWRVTFDENDNPIEGWIRDNQGTDTQMKHELILADQGFIWEISKKRANEICEGWGLLFNHMPILDQRVKAKEKNK